MSKESLRKRLEAKRKNLNSKGKSGKVLFIKEDETLRVRPLPVGDDQEFVFEMVQFYLGSEIKGVYSASTIGKPCPIQEKYEELKNSKDKDDKELAKALVPKRKYLMPVVVYKDLRGKEVDKENSGKLVQITGDIYKQIIDLWLDEEDWGDPTDPINGYDLKLGRVGSGKLDTTYSCQPCPKSETPREFRAIVNLEEKIEEVIESYDEALDKLNSFLGEPSMLRDPESSSPKKSSLKEKREKRRSNTDE